MTRASLLFLVPALMLGGCIKLLPDPPPAPRIYVLEAGDVQRAEGAPVDAVLTVSDPIGSRTIMGADVVWRTGDQMAYIAQTAWPSHADDLLQTVLIDTISRQGRFRAVVRPSEATGNYEIRWTVMNFEITEGDMKAHFTAQANLVAPGRRILASELITAEAPVADRSATAATNALARAAREGSARIGLFAADAAAQAQAQAAEADQARAASINR
jgi:cholesterol transport system auxiliary component